MTTLNGWIEQQYRHCAKAMLRSISPLTLVKDRPGFGQSIRASKGAVIASPVLGAYDPDPDYFFHWFRDSALVIDALRLLWRDGTLGAEALGHFSDFVHFSLNLRQLDGRTLLADRQWRTAVTADFEKFVRPDDELGTVRGDAIVAETRVNPNGTVDISKWGRPQNDGPPLRALTLLHWFHDSTFEPQLDAAASTLLRADLSYTCSHWPDPCYDIWEEEKGQHYYTLCVSAYAMEQGSRWLNERGDKLQAQALRVQAEAIRQLLNSYWSAEQGYYRSRILEAAVRSTKELDIAVILAAIHAPSRAAAHSVSDPKMHATLESLERLFVRDYPINHDLPAGRAPAMGRYAGDVYYSGGAYYFSTLGAAQFCYEAALHSFETGAWIARGDAYLETVRAYTPPDGELSEQFDKKTGAQSSARQLAWSYAAFISCVTARRAVMSSSR